MVSGGAGTIASLFGRTIRRIQNEFEANKFRKAIQTKNVITIQRTRKKLKEKFSSKRVKDIEALAKTS